MVAEDSRQQTTKFEKHKLEEPVLDHKISL